MTYVIDASALLRFTDKEAGAERVRTLLHSASRGDTTVSMSAVNWGEIVTVHHRRMGLAGAQAVLGNLATLPLEIVPADKDLAEVAGRFKWSYKIPYADAFAAALAQQEQATLMTSDYDFKNLPKGLLKIEFLPIK
jgi:tRNA(fMet)-specific endonuclease VapC